MADDRALLKLELADETATNFLGEDIALMLKAGDVLALSGDLGMGKSTLARAIIRAMAGDRALEVPSPTFTLVQAYATRIPVQHFDLYRLASPDELEELGFADAVRDDVVLVEWPERAGELMPAGTVRVAISGSGTGRIAVFDGPPDFIERLERSLSIRAFLDRSGFQGATRSFLIGDASTRAYETVKLGTQAPSILMNAPRRPDGPPIRDGKPYSRIAHLAESVVPFVAIAKAMRDEGFAAPEIPAADLYQGLLLVEHLGTQGMLDDEGRPVEERYLAAAEVLAALHSRKWPEEIDVEPTVVHRVPPYDHEAMAIETELAIDWYLPHQVGRQATKQERSDFAAAWQDAFFELDKAERSLVLRDYHSPNLIWRPKQVGNDRVGIIDFQDAMIGPSAYDVASLALDARVTIPAELESRIVAAYCAARLSQGDFDRAAFDKAYAVMAAQRNSKILGIFVRLNVRDGKPGYLKHLPRIRDYLTRALIHPALKEVAAVYRQAGLL